MRTLVTVLLSICLITGTATAGDHPQGAKRMVIRDTDTTEALAWTVKGGLPLPAASPTIVGARLDVEADSGETASFDLPASGWTVNGTETRYVFRNPLAPNGPSPVKRVALRAGRGLRVFARASGITLDEGMQGTMTLVLTVGSDLYCSAPHPRATSPDATWRGPVPRPSRA